LRKNKEYSNIFWVFEFGFWVWASNFLSIWVWVLVWVSNFLSIWVWVWVLSIYSKLKHFKTKLNLAKWFIRDVQMLLIIVATSLKNWLYFKLKISSLKHFNKVCFKLDIFNLNFNQFFKEVATNINNWGLVITKVLKEHDYDLNVIKSKMKWSVRTYRSDGIVNVHYL